MHAVCPFPSGFLKMVTITPIHTLLTNKHLDMVNKTITTTSTQILLTDYYLDMVKQTITTTFAQA